MASEVIITLGAASAVPDGLMSIGLPGLGGLIAVVVQESTTRLS